LWSRHSTRRAGFLLFAAALITSLATTAEANESHKLIHVDEASSHQLGRHCQYASRIRGTLQPLGSRALPADDMRYRPDLRITAHLDCRGVAHQRISNTLHGGSMSRTEVERQVERLSRISIGTDGTMCFYASDVRFDGHSLAALDVRRWCRVEPPAHGGGPTPIF
jgi:hypothetical protein